jgi:hypothetical protein
LKTFLVICRKANQLIFGFRAQTIHQLVKMRGCKSAVDVLCNRTWLEEARLEQGVALLGVSQGETLDQTRVIENLG